MRDTVTTTIDLLRHGEPVGGNKYRGQTDDPLSDTGWHQMRAATAQSIPWQQIISSPLSRCAEFARELSQQRNLPLSLQPGFKEIGFGQWEGRTAADILANEPDSLHRFWQDPVKHTPPGAEPLTDFAQRIEQAWHSTLQGYAGQHLLIVGHAGMMRMILRLVLQMPVQNSFRFQVPYAALIRIQVDDHGQGLVLPRLIFSGPEI